jgi:hypothetical protein
MSRLAALRLAILAALAVGGCKLTPAGTGGHAGTNGGGTAGTGMGGGGAGGRGGTGTGGGGGTTPLIHLDGGNDGPTTTPDANCGARSKTASKVAPDILILLDRSGSMNDDINDQMCRPDGGIGAAAGCGPDSKWAKVTPAITQVVSETEADVNWGLKFFPDSATAICSVSSTAAVPVGPGNGAAIAAAIMGATSANGGVVGFNGTPTRSAAAGATTYMMGLTDMSPKYILLATDGLPTCANNSAMADDSAAAVTAVDTARMAGFPTFVVGIATSGATSDTTLSNLANAGGLPRSGMPTYYPVSSAADLAAAIRTLIGVAATCTFQIGPAPTSDGTTDLKYIKVFGDNVEITRDKTHANGYDYTDDTMNAIQVYGPLCDQILSGAIHDVTVAFTCVPV